MIWYNQNKLNHYSKDSYYNDSTLINYLPLALGNSEYSTDTHNKLKLKIKL